MKKILGLDIGTNSIGWALIQQDFQNKKGEIIKLGSRIIPMSQEILGKFDSGQSHSQTSERTRYRGVRRLYERSKLRRERLHRVLNVLGFLPDHYAKQIDFKQHYGKFLPESEPKLAYNEKNQFIFKTSFNEMLEDFKKHQPNLLINKNGQPALIPYDWTVYYLRKKALTQKIEKAELAWLLLHFNQKRGYYQLRGEEEEEEKVGKSEKFYRLKVINVEDSGDRKGNDQVWYNVILENGWIYRRASKIPLKDWVGKIKEFIVTTDVDENGQVKTDKEGKEKRSFRAPKEDDWTLIKKKTEQEIDESDKHVGTYIYDTLLQNPNQKIRGKLVQTIERKLYKDELRAILRKQISLHPELKDRSLYIDCLDELYRQNESHKRNIVDRGFEYLFLDDLIFYQRPLKTKKSQISECRFENRSFTKDGKKEIIGVKCIAKSHPLFQEFRLWQWLDNLRIYAREKEVNGKLEIDVTVTDLHIKDENDKVALFDFLNNRKEINQKALLKYFGLTDKNYRWNFVEEKNYPCNETRTQIIYRLEKVENASVDFLTKEVEEHLWHILYSVSDKEELEKALGSFAVKHKLDKSFVEVFKKFPPFKKEYGAYSAKAIKKFLPLMRIGKYWSEENITRKVKDRIDKIINGEYDDTIKDRVREKAFELNDLSQFNGLPLWLASYIVYDRHSENETNTQWKSPEDIDNYLKEFRQHSLRNPIVEQVVTETLRTVRDIWKELGGGKENFFDEIHIELGREMKNPSEERKRLTNLNTENENTNLRIKAILKELANDTKVQNVRPYSPSQQELLKIYEDGILKSGVDVPDDIAKISKLSQPSRNDVIRYKAWLEQGYCSPYTNKMIPLNKLFTPIYEIEHVIPQRRYFDDSFSNKVICESEVNKLKGNQLGFEFIKNHGGEKVILSTGETVEILKTHAYEDYVKSHYGNNRSKMKKLLMEEIPEKFIERQINDTRYISKFIMNLLSNIVREEGETEVRAKKVIACTGGITNRLKRDWGFNDIWNDIVSPRFQRLNEMTETDHFGRINPNTQKFLPEVPLELQKGFSKKRIDHRHHPLDAVLIACASADHVNYLNNENHIRKGKNKEEKTKIRFDLRSKLCYKTKPDERGNYKWRFHKPWETITQETRTALQCTVVSFKQNLRVINKTVNKYQKWVKTDEGLVKKELVKQNGRNWSIRKPMHKETVYGKVTIKKDKGKSVILNNVLGNPEMIIDNTLRKIVTDKSKELNGDISTLKKYFKTNPLKINDQKITKVNIYEWVEGTASRVTLDTSFKKEKIEKSVTDSGIQKILIRHLNQEKYQNQTDENDKMIPPEELAFSPEGIEDMNKSMLALNNGKLHQPIYKVRIYEEGSRFAIGETGNKTTKYVEAAKGTNLFFAIYWNEEKQKREFETIPLNEVMEHQKQVAHLPKEERTLIPAKPEKGQFLFSLSPNDLVYVPTEEERENPISVDFKNLTKEQVNRVYKVVSSTGNKCHFILSSVASLVMIYDAKSKIGEFGSLNKMEVTIDLDNSVRIKELCWKLDIDRLGKIVKVIR